MEKSRIIELIAKKTGKIATAEELDELSMLLSKYPDYAYLYEIVQSLKGSPNHFEKNIPREELVNHGWKRLIDKSNELPETEIETGSIKNPVWLTPRRPVYRKRWLTAAAAIICIGGSLLYFQSRESESPARPVASKTVNVRYGATSKIILPDGTEVRLNAGSKLIYPEHFSGTKREVFLEGEAFFDVTRDQHAPFLVHAGKIRITVLGTRFNVKAYKGDANVETTLISGKVQVMLNDDPEKKITLTPREKLTVVNTPKTDTARTREAAVSNELRYQVQELPETANNSFVETAWISNRLILSNDDFESVARLLERRYNVTVFFDRASLKQEHISGVFEKENISQVLEILKMTTKFNYRIDGNDIHLF
jgi:ferric-dicitrate binding protein FerR (iron transport regulator)